MKPLITRNDLTEALRANTELQALGPSAAAVLAMTASGSSSLDDIAAVIKQDQALTLKVLRLANSSLYSNGERVDSIKKAVSRIGVAQVRTTVMSIGVLSAFSGNGQARLKTDRFWEHCIGTAIIARSIATARQTRVDEAEQLFTAGLLHDVGRMLYADRLGELYTQVLAVADRLELPLDVVESRLLLINHAEMTDRLLHLWKFPAELINPIAMHHMPLGNIQRMMPRGVGPVATLALANRLAHALIMGSSGDDVLYPIEEFIEALNLADNDLRDIAARAPEEAAEMRAAMLAGDGDNMAPGTTALDDAQDTLGSEVVPLHIALSPASDSAGYMLQRLCPAVAGVRPTVAVVRVTYSTERTQLVNLLQQREQLDGTPNLPVLVVGATPTCFFAPGQLGTRSVTQVVSPIRRERLLHAMVHLAESHKSEAAAAA